MHDRRSLRGFTLAAVSTSPNTVNFERKRLDNRVVSGAGKATSPRASSRDHEGHEATGAFAEIWASNGLEGYNDLIAYFGPVQVDIQLLREHYASRIRQIRTDHLVLEEANSRSNEFVAKEQRTMRHAVAAMNMSLQLQKKHMTGFPEKYEEEILKPLDNLGIAMKVKLEKIVSSHATAVADIQGKKNDLDNIINDIQEINKQLKMKTTEDGEIDPEFIAENQKRRTSAFFRTKGKVEETPEMLEERLNNLRQNRRDAEAALIDSESKNSEAIIDAMNQLEILEFNRIQKLKEIMEHAAKLEVEYMEGLIDATMVGYNGIDAAGLSSSTPLDSSDTSAPPPSANKLLDTIEMIDPPKDIKSTFYMLKSKAESTRPTGRPRRANSLVRNSRFLEMLGELNIPEVTSPTVPTLSLSPKQGTKMSLQEQKI